MWDQLRGYLQFQPCSHSPAATLAALTPRPSQLLPNLYHSLAHLNNTPPMNPLRNALAGTQQFLQNAASNAQPMMRSAYAGTQQFLHDAASTTRDKAAGVEWDKAPKHIQDYITEHPYQTAFYVVNGVVIAAPFVVAGPLLGAVGFTAAGPAAGELLPRCFPPLSTIG